MENQSLQQIVRRAVEQPYQERSQRDNEMLVMLLTQVVLQLETQSARILTLFLQSVPTDSTQFKKNCQVGSIVIQKGIQDKFKQIDIGCRQYIEELDLTKFTLYIGAECIIRSKHIQSIEQQIKFLRNCRYLQQLPRRKLYHVLRNADIKAYPFNQSVYKEKQSIDLGQSSFYLVRQGQFAYKKNIQTQQSIILYQFGSSEAFGAEDLTQGQQTTIRQFGVVCRSAKGLVYKFSQDFYFSFLKSSCDDALSMNQKNLTAFLNERIKTVQKCRQASYQLISQSRIFSRSISLLGTFLTVPDRPQLSSSIDTSDSVVLPKKQERNHKLPSLNSNSLKYKQQSTKAAQHNNIQNPEYQQLLMIQRKKQKYHRVRSILNNKVVCSRGEILLGLVKSSWNNYKSKAKTFRK